MGFLNRFFDEVFDQSIAATPENSFADINQGSLAAHLDVDQYERFQLTDAVRPALDLKIKPVEGYRHDVYIDESSGAKVPVIMAAATRQKLFPLFMQLIQRLGPVVDVVLETSHEHCETGKHVDLYREHIDLPVLTSLLWEYEDLLTNDGCTGIAVLNPNVPQEVQFDEHKLLIMYGSPLEPFEHTLETDGISNRPKMQFITEAEHIHSSSEEMLLQFDRLRTDLGLDGSQREDAAGEDGLFEGESFC